MNFFNCIIRIFVYVVIFCPLRPASCGKHGKLFARHYSKRSEVHKHDLEPPCATCPRQSACVPKVQCPAHVRPGSHNPVCHLDRNTGLLGICCFTGSAHAAESDTKSRATAPVEVKNTKLAHNQSAKKLAACMKKEEQLLVESSNTVVRTSSPSFAHHLSLVTYDENVDELGKGGLLNLFAAQELKARQALSDEDLVLGFTDHTDGPFCPPQPSCPNPPSRYRSIGGECNNQEAPTWGASNTGFERLLPPAYDDGIWEMRKSVSGLPLPSARTVSSSLIMDSDYPSRSHNLLFMQFGQFIAHDTSSGVVYSIGNRSAISCCLENGEDFLSPELQHWACAPIGYDTEDVFYGQFQQRCMNFVRTQLVPSPDCSVGYAKQMNGATQFPDLSHIYGSTPKKFRALKGSEGLLKVFMDYGRELPPLSAKKDCMTTKEGAACFESGDNHGNQIISLTILHTVFTREHNRVARALVRLNPDWDEDTVFMEARRIVQAEYQHIIYDEWLPLLLGPKLLKAFNLHYSPGHRNYYDSHINPSLTAEFATAAMRYGHSTVDRKLLAAGPSGSAYELIFLPEVMFQPGRLRLRPFLDRMIKGLSWQPMQNVDPFVTESLTKYLFHGGNPFGLDLAAINIQRGRDYGTRPYNDYRKLVGLEPLVDFQQYPPNTANRLASVYESPEDIDLWVGGLLEEQVEGGVVGLTFANIIADQFSRSMRGDRYFYEYGPEVNPGAFTPSQLEEIKKVSLARILCDNRDGYELLTMSPNAFLQPILQGNEPVPCDSPQIPAMDLSRFKEI